MPSIDENRNRWSTYEWEHAGDEWSVTWGGTDHLWWGALFPRLIRFLPVARGLEIAPGFGRITDFLRHYCKQLTVVDVTERCIEACKERFQGDERITYHVNDGTSLSMIEDSSVDFAISFDSLVHAEADVLRSYVHEITRVLTPEGFAFLHHSNLGAFRDAETGELPFENKHWRSPSMSAEKLRQDCDDAGAVCILQELVNWGGTEVHDCLSVFVRKDSPHRRELETYANPDFMDEAGRLARLAHYYRRA